MKIGKIAKALMIPERSVRSLFREIDSSIDTLTENPEEEIDRAVVVEMIGYRTDRIGKILIRLLKEEA